MAEKIVLKSVTVTILGTSSPNVMLHIQKGVFSFYEGCTPEEAVRLGEALVQAGRLAIVARGEL